MNDDALPCHVSLRGPEVTRGLQTCVVTAQSPPKSRAAFDRGAEDKGLCKWAKDWRYRISGHLRGDDGVLVGEKLDDQGALKPVEVV